MSTTIVWNGISYSIPDVGDVEWGENLNAFFVALPAGALQKTGGNFTLTGEVNFGNTYGLKAKVFKSTNSSGIAQSEILRMANGEGIAWRNAGSDGDLPLITNANNELLFDGNKLVYGVSPTFYSNRVIVSDVDGVLSALDAGDAGQVLTSNGASAPSFANTTGSGTVNSGAAGSIALYPSSSAVIDDAYAQNSNLISLVIASHAGLASTRTYTIPDAGANASVVLTEGTTGVCSSVNLLRANPSTANTYGAAGRMGFGTATPLFRYHFKGDGNPLLYELTFAGDSYAGGLIGPLANNIWWNKNGTDTGGAAGDVAFIGTVVMNETVGHNEMGEIGICIVDPNPGSATARMIFEVRANGGSWFTNGAFGAIDPIAGDGASFKIGPGDDLTATVPANGGIFLSSADSTAGVVSAGAQQVVGGYTARGTDPIVIDLGVGTAGKLRICSDSGQIPGVALTPTERFSVDGTEVSCAVPLSMGSNAITDLDDGVAATDAATVGQITSSITGFPGEIRMYGSTSAPTGWLICDGTSYLRASYTALFAVVGTSFGAVDGTHFNVPDFRDNTPVGKSGTKALGSTGGAASTTLPNHAHDTASDIQAASGWAADEAAPIGYDAEATYPARIFQLTTAGNHANTRVIKNYTNTDGGGASIATQSPYLAVSFIIKT